jgi:tetratricopeptide (TPR) repeat protein
LGLAYLAFVQQNMEIALDYYLQAAQINPKSADAHYGIGRVFLETQHEGEAVEEFRKTLSLDPTYYEARETLTALGVAV